MLSCNDQLLVTMSTYPSLLKSSMMLPPARFFVLRPNLPDRSVKGFMVQLLSSPGNVSNNGAGTCSGYPPIAMYAIFNSHLDSRSSLSYFNRVLYSSMAFSAACLFTCTPLLAMGKTQDSPL